MNKPDPPIQITPGQGPVVAAAIHDGHGVRPEVEEWMALSPRERLREEDPFTGRWIDVAPTRILGLRSRFEVDLNRPRDGAVYLTPEQAWGLKVWKQTPSAQIVERSLRLHDRAYLTMKQLFDEKIRRHGRFVLLDLHSYNHRRDGPGAPPAPERENPQINLGTGTLGRREPWAGLIQRFINDFSSQERPDGTTYDVRENVKFRGGYLGQWVHQTYPDAGLALSIEVKKFFMDECTGEPVEAEITAVRAALAKSVAGVLDELEATTRR